MLPRDDTLKAMRNRAREMVGVTRAARERFLSKWAEHVRERDAYAKLPSNPLTETHRVRGERIKAEAYVDLPDPASVTEMRRTLDAQRRELDLRSLLHKGARLVPVKDDSDLREMLNLTLMDRFERRFKAMDAESQAAELQSIRESLDFNGPTPEQAARLAVIDLVHASAPLKGSARSELIKLFGGSDGNEHTPGALEERWKARSMMLDDITATDRDLRAAEGFAHAILHPEAPLPVAASMSEAERKGFMSLKPQPEQETK